MARIQDVVVDCGHPAYMARFRVAVVDGYAVAPYGEAELALLRAEGIDSPEDDPTVLVEAAPGVTPRLVFQLVPEAETVENGLHVDLGCGAEGLEAEIARIEALGGRLHAAHDDHVVLADPEGDEFCLQR